MRKSYFAVPQMDCPSEERLIRMALAKFKIEHLAFDLKDRKLTVLHKDKTEEITKALEGLNLGAKIIEDAETIETKPTSEKDESGVLKILLLINFAMFIIEVGLGFYAQSTGLIADSFDMLADAIVYGVSLYAVGKAVTMQHKAARLSGWFQIALALFAFSEVIRRFFYGSEPNSSLMMGVSVVALIANAGCLILLMKHRDGAVHMKASWIFSTNDVLANIGVIVAGVLVGIFRSPWPDLVIGMIIAALVTKGALSILKISAVKNASH